ncbi:protein-tyrosine phosphatase [Cognatiyoonia koreensis]|uniref:protein-tyrosine-phosphatase n=1 Tax=Cognatiyoonia koreensis TaxID=364200 RepID=A0A1I0N6M6_9RHOB|nr:low molecular weight protein-tyrosine-phosphatase [Cognatiyoonia koreensis]SEV96037.1 protein-tyrosine phosphatase [Cognatiyoonia koreensis]
MRVICVCLGNICRSPAAEGVLRTLAPDWTVASAGTGGWHVGDPPYGPMQKAALTKGYDLSGLRAAQFSDSDFHKYDLILAMDGQNLADIENLRPDGADTPVQLFADQDVPDPYYTRDFEGVLTMIEFAARRLIDRHALRYS